MRHIIILTWFGEAGSLRNVFELPSITSIVLSLVSVLLFMMISVTFCIKNIFLVSINHTIFLSPVKNWLLA